VTTFGEKVTTFPKVTLIPQNNLFYFCVLWKSKFWEMCVTFGKVVTFSPKVVTF